ncbi:hypothetical protein M8J77_004917 [Diaphorina citri]|nr:hypothetical protein M8J77_004917 [Diaphorina citri]
MDFMSSDRGIFVDFISSDRGIFMDFMSSDRGIFMDFMSSGQFHLSTNTVGFESATRQLLSSPGPPPLKELCSPTIYLVLINISPALVCNVNTNASRSRLNLI